MGVSGQVIEIFDYLGEKLGLAIDWGSENVFPYIKLICENLVKYNIAMSIVNVVVGLLFCIGLIVCCRIMHKSYKSCITTKEDTALFEYNPYYDGDFSINPNLVCCFGLAFCVIAFVCGLCFTIIGFGDLIKWVFIPEISLIEYITGFVSQL